MARGSLSQWDSGAWLRSRKCLATPPAVHLTSPGLMFPRVPNRLAPRSACSRGLEASVLSPYRSVSTAAAPHATSGAGYWEHLPVSGTLMRRQVLRDPAGLPPRWALGTLASPPNSPWATVTAARWHTGPDPPMEETSRPRTCTSCLWGRGRPEETKHIPWEKQGVKPVTWTSQGHTLIGVDTTSPEPEAVEPRLNPKVLHPKTGAESKQLGSKATSPVDCKDEDAQGHCQDLSLGSGRNACPPGMGDPRDHLLLCSGWPHPLRP